MSVYFVPAITTESDSNDFKSGYTPDSRGEAIVDNVVGGIVTAIIVDMVPGPAVPG